MESKTKYRIAAGVFLVGLVTSKLINDSFPGSAAAYMAGGISGISLLYGVLESQYDDQETARKEGYAKGLSESYVKALEK